MNNMETIKTSKGSFLFVEVDKSGIGFICDMGYLIYTGRSGRRMYVKLPEGEYEFIGKSYNFNCLMLLTPHLLKVDSNYAILKVL